MHALVAATLGYGSTHKEPFDQLEDGGTLLWPGQSQQVLRNDASKSTVEVSAPADAAPASASIRCQDETQPI